jgi:hypothetical protein
MRFRLTLILAGILAIPSIGLAQKVRFDYDHGAKFTGFSTYHLVRIGDNPAVSQLYDQRIISAIEEELAKKGLRKVDTGGDLFIGYQGSVDKQTQYTTFNDGGSWGYGPGWGYGAGWGGPSMSTTTQTTIPVGALTVDIMDPTRKQLIWRGTATDTLSDKPEKNNQKIQKAVKKLFEKYPPKEKK